MEQMPKIENNQNIFDFKDLVASTISKKQVKLNKFYELKNNPNKIIRVEGFDELSRKHDNKIEIPDLIEIARKLYKELAEQYGISLSADFAISKDLDGKNVVCSIADKVEGRHLGEVDMSEDFLGKVEKLYTMISRYFLDKFKEGGLYVWDINGESQYVYGKKAGDTEDKIYLIDIDIWLSKNKDDMYLSVYWLSRHMSNLEHRLGVQFQEARNYIIEFINQPLAEDVDESVIKNIDETKKIINGEKTDYTPESAIPRFE